MDWGFYIALIIAIVASGGLFVSVVRLGRFKRLHLGDKYRPSFYFKLALPFSRAWRNDVDPADLLVAEQLRLRLYWSYLALFLLPFVAATTYMRWDISEKLAEFARTLDASTQLLQQRRTDGAAQRGPTTSP